MIIITVLLIIFWIVWKILKPIRCMWCKKWFLYDELKVNRWQLWYKSINCTKCGWVHRL